ncbi:sigma-54 interaction domain-containing protein [Oceanobacillus jeddahense]|uniref:sigma-54 interaction domain-containing protein n=1 Tax=Oceanobacillus jeddahense TaxID=1462527 RepID=UPI0036355F68
MNLFPFEISHVLNRNLKVLEKNSWKTFDLYKVAKETNPTKIFLKNNEEIQFVQLFNETNEIVLTPCKEAPSSISFTKLMNTVETFGHVIIQDNGKYIGYVNATAILKQIMNTYKKMEAYFKTVLQTIDSSCTAIDSNQNVLIWTEGAERIFSVKQEDIIGKKITDFFAPERLEVLKSITEGSSVTNSQHHAREDLVVMINSNPVYLNKEVIGAVVSETNITSQIRLHNELSNTTEKLFNLEKEVNKLMPSEDPFVAIKGNSNILKKTISMTRKAATTNTNILIYGESGVGKELFAKAVHNIREGQNAPFVPINCGAIPSTLFESEIFGYEKGAFSGADQKGKKGKVELAKGGTLFLDEIGEMPLDMQVKILRLLQEKKFFSVGGTKEKEVDFRVVAATNRNLKKLVEEGKFREDLYYRLNVVNIEIPPLRSRPEDVIELTHYFLYEISIKYNRPIYGISQAVMQALLQHDWPGNIRELKNGIERLVVFSENGEIKVEDLPFEIGGTKSAPGKQLPYFTEYDNRALSERLEEVEKEIILKQLEKENGNKLACAKTLQITRATLYNRINKLGLDV